jgi:hypothetical protein
MTVDGNISDSNALSALQENIEEKGKNSYYFAHKNTPTGPKWDGKQEPRLLSRHSTNASDESYGSLHISNDEAQNLLSTLKSSPSSFNFAKSSITKYAFLDDGAKIKIYVELKGVGDICSDNDISLDWKERSFTLVVRNYKDEVETDTCTDGNTKECADKCLSFGRLHGPIKKATMRKKTDKIVLILTKSVEEGGESEEWPNIGFKGDYSQQNA